MRARPLSASILLFVCAAAVAAQGKWDTFHPSADAFTIETPFSLSQQGETGKNEWRKYSAGNGDTYLYVFSDPAAEAHQIAMVVEFAKSQGQVLSIGKHLISPLHFQDEFGYWNTISGLNTGSRILVVQAVTLDETSPIAAQFVSTFKPGRNTESPADPPVTSTEGPIELRPTESVGAGKDSSTGLGIGSGISAGSGTGNGTGRGIPVGAVRPPPPVGSRPLHILSKPRPGYTDLARNYDINGTVILRIAFLETGKVGVVTVVKGLPFGLTQQTVTAAKRITFEPELIEGRPSSTTKQVEYSFSIY